MGIFDPTGSGLGGRGGGIADPTGSLFGGSVFDRSRRSSFTPSFQRSSSTLGTRLPVLPRRRSSGSSLRSKGGSRFNSFDKAAFEEAAREEAARNWFSQLLANAGGEVMDMVTGAPSAAQLVGRAMFTVDPITTTIGEAGRLPGLDNPVSRLLRDEKYQSARDVARGGWGIAQGLEQNWGPAVSTLDAIRRGDLPRAQRDARRLGANLYEHPVTMGLDVAGAYTVAGAGIRLGSSGIAKIGGSTGAIPAESAVGRYLSQVGSRSVLSRQAPPRIYPGMQRAAAEGRPAMYQPDLALQRRALSPNPLSRPTQRAFYRASDAMRNRTMQWGQRHLDDARMATPAQRPSWLARTLSTEGRRAKWEGKLAREDVVSGYENATEIIKETATPYREAQLGALRLGRRGGYSRRQIETAQALHHQGILDQPGMTPQQARALALENAEGLGGHTSAANRAVIESLPDELLSYSTLPPRVRQLVDEGKALARAGTERAVAAGHITPETAAARVTMPANVAAGRQRWNPTASPLDPDVAAREAHLARLRADRDALGGQPITPAGMQRTMHVAFGRGRRYGKAERQLEGRPAIPASPRQQPAILSPDDAVATARSDQAVVGAYTRELERRIQSMERDITPKIDSMLSPEHRRTEVNYRRKTTGKSRLRTRMEFQDREGMRVSVIDQLTDAIDKGMPGITDADRALVRQWDELSELRRDLDQVRQHAGDPTTQRAAAELIRRNRPDLADVRHGMRARPGERRPAGIAPGQATDYGSMTGAAGSQQNAVWRQQQRIAMERDIARAQRDLGKARKARRHQRGMWEYDEGPRAGQDAAFWRHYNPDREAAGLGSPPTPGAGIGRVGQPPIHRSEGQLARSFGYSTSSDVPAVQFAETVLAEQQGRVVQNLVDRSALRVVDDAGQSQIATGATTEKALAQLGNRSDEYVAVSRNLLERNVRAGEQAEGWMPLSSPELPQFAKSHGNDMVVLPRSAVEAIREANKPLPSGRLGSNYDKALTAWKRGQLALAPRWILNNVFGNTTQFGLLAPADFASILAYPYEAVARQVMQRFGASEANVSRFTRNTVWSKAVEGSPSRAVPARALTGLRAEEAGRRTGLRARGIEAQPGPVSRAWTKITDGPDRGIGRVVPFGINFNQRLENRLRRVAYKAAERKGLRAEGVNPLFKDPDSLAKAIDDMPVAARTEVMRDFELFMGEYKRMNPFEQNVMRRVFPFYSWMRVIGRLMATMPFRHPLKTAVSAHIAEVGTDIASPDDWSQPWYNRGRVGIHVIPGGKERDYSFRSIGANPFATHAEILGGGVTAATTLADHGRPSFGPLLQGMARDVTPLGGRQLLEYAGGRDPFGNRLTAPPGELGTVQEYGQDPSRLDPSINLPVDAPREPNVYESMLQTLPLVPQLARTGATQGDVPYDTAATIDLLRYRFGLGGDPGNLFMFRRDAEDASDPPAERPAGLWSPFLSWTGLNVHRRNRDAEQELFEKRIKDFLDAQRQTARQIERG